MTLAMAYAVGGPARQLTQSGYVTPENQLNNLVRTYRNDILRNDTPRQLVYLGDEIRDTAKALGQIVVLPAPAIAAPSPSSHNNVAAVSVNSPVGNNLSLIA